MEWEEGEEFLLADELPTIQSNRLSPFAGCVPIRGRVPWSRRWWYRRSIWSISAVHPGVALRPLVDSADSHPDSSSSPSPLSVSGMDESTPPAKLFRSNVFTTPQRSTQDGRTSRMELRRGIDELTVRMTLTSIGGTLPPLDGDSLKA